MWVGLIVEGDLIVVKVGADVKDCESRGGGGVQINWDEHVRSRSSFAER